MDKTWIGSIFIRDEGGFEIIMRALNHYNRRLHRITRTPEIADAGATLGSILQSESIRTASRLKPIANRLREGLADPAVLATLHDDMETVKKAMLCYKADCQKAADGISYYTDMLKDNTHVQEDMAVVDAAIGRLEEYSE